MSLRQSVQNAFEYIPSVSQPDRHVPFKQKLLWTAGILVAYFVLTNVPIWGLSQTGAGSDLFGNFRSILAGAQGSVLQLGIGPIVTASIVLQLLSGADLLGLDLDNPRDQQLYQSLQKVLVFAMVFITGVPLVFSGGFLPASATLAGTLGIGVAGVQLLMFIQIALGGIFIMYMDEVISKWGIGSGVGLFIVAGVAQQLFGGVINIGATWLDIATGSLELTESLSETIITVVVGPGSLLAILMTALIFYVIVYAESTRVEIPVSNARVKGARGRFPVKLIYASVMPLILVRAVQANVQFLGRFLDEQLGGTLPTWIGTYPASRQPTGGLFYVLAPIQSPEQWMWFLGGITAEPWELGLRLLFDLSWMLIGGAIFAIFWVETTGMGADKSAAQLKNSGLEIPGFRSNQGIMEKVLERYIPFVTVIGGALVGLLAVMANMFGAIGGVTGTGLLLAVSITYKIYEEIAEEKMMDMNQQFRALFSG